MKFYIEFKTWAEGYVDIPWPWAKFEEIADYRLISDLKVKASSEKVRSIFVSMNENLCNKFLRDYVAALVVGVTITASDLPSALDEIRSVFGLIELLGSCEVTDSNRSHIEEVMGRAQQNTAHTV